MNDIETKKTIWKIQTKSWFFEKQNLQAYS